MVIGSTECTATSCLRECALGARSVFDANAHVRFRLAVIPRFLPAAIDATPLFADPPLDAHVRVTWRDRVGIREWSLLLRRIDSNLACQPSLWWRHGGMLQLAGMQRVQPAGGADGRWP
jgi:hypothetical protein